MWSGGSWYQPDIAFAGPHNQYQAIRHTSISTTTRQGCLIVKATTLTFLCLTTLATQAHASSPDAWAAYDKAVLASCTKASGLKNAKPVGNAAQFDDRVGYTALLLQGQYPQKYMKGQQGTELCLYNKQSKTAYVTEWDSIRPTAKAQ
jgi:hypothetical protein